MRRGRLCSLSRLSARLSEPAVSAAQTAAVSQYVLKVHSRCDLACDHCYVYEHADQSWRVKARAISLKTVDLAARRIAEHAAAHDLPRVGVVLHGGEPLLLGRDAMRGVLATLTARITPASRLDIRIHTNGVQLDEKWCELFGEYGVAIGVSLDGDRPANDRHRRYADGRSSHAQVLRSLGLLRRPEFRRLYAGILCTIDLANDPVVVYRALAAERPPRLDLLLPHATWDRPPSRPAGLPHPYADWLLAVYRCWVREGRPIPIRLFDSVLSAIRGGPSWTEVIGLDPVDLLVIDTDGSWEQADSMKTAFDGAPATGMRVQSHAVDEVAAHPGVAARYGGLGALCATCRMCPVVRVCGGGLYAHRYRSGTGFGNPSVYCADLMELIGTLTAKVTLMQSDPRPVHKLMAGAFDTLAAGPGDIAAVGTLAQMRLSLTRALVAAVAAALDGPRSSDLAAAAAEGWSVLCDLDATHPGAVAEIFSHPYTHAWAMRCLNPPPGADTKLDQAHLAGLAAAAAVLAGISAELPVPAREGLLHLPTLGALAAGVSAGHTERVQISGGSPVTDGRTWYPVRRMTSRVLRLAVDDLDPFRDCQQWPVAGRLGEQDWQAWRRCLAAAARRLARDVPAYAQAMGAGLRTVVPLLLGDTGTHSATARHAFGAIAVTLAAAGGRLDEPLVHEFQHVKLYALCDLFELFDATDTHRLPVPWRHDSRPVEGVLHGTYAHLGLAQLSRARGAAGRSDWLRYRAWVCGACEALRDTKALTPVGERFVSVMFTVAEGTSDEEWPQKELSHAIAG
jgi:uncharacterized protein